MPTEGPGGPDGCSQCVVNAASGANFCAACGRRLGPPGAAEVAASADEPTTELVLEIDLPAHPAVLVATQGPAAGSRFELSHSPVTVGRHPDSEIFLDDITVSRRHAEVTREGLVRRVRDKGSLNGTYLNGRRVEEAGLKNGDELQVGRFKLVYYDGTGP
ncbi:FHA domain-containing protein [Candidatus Poriferisocius sp.]|uniref:FHA domain-containing protein n=1 Tax=Candidatus Poriferisocius sp. TaxID=3101276 RepID=UPI003B5C0858